jgi:hypothetical protein
MAGMAIGDCREMAVRERHQRWRVDPEALRRQRDAEEALAARAAGPGGELSLLGGGLHHIAEADLYDLAQRWTAGARGMDLVREAGLEGMVTWQSLVTAVRHYLRSQG